MIDARHTDSQNGGRFYIQTNDADTTSADRRIRLTSTGFKMSTDNGVD